MAHCIICLHLEIFCSEPIAPIWYFEEPLYSLLKYKNFEEKKWNDQKTNHCSAVPNDRLVVEPFYETMKLWHCVVIVGTQNPKDGEVG
jgi:hypothetical protein